MFSNNNYKDKGLCYPSSHEKFFATSLTTIQIINNVIVEVRKQPNSIPQNEKVYFIYHCISVASHNVKDNVICDRMTYIKSTRKSRVLPPFHPISSIALVLVNVNHKS